MVCAYIDDVLVVTKNYFKVPLKALEKVLKILAEVGLKVNAERYVFNQIETEYIGFWISRNGVRPLPSTIEAINSN